MKDIVYNSVYNEVLTFSKNDVWHWNPMAPFSEEKITFKCDSHKHYKALRLKKAGKDKWALIIDWSIVKMDSKEEVFTVEVFYSNNSKLRQPVKITYTQIPISINHFDISLSQNQSVWGADGELCSLQLCLKREFRSWMFKDTKCTVQFKHSDDKGFFPLQGDNTVIFDIKETSQIKVPLKYIGYDRSINKELTDRVFFSINGIDCSVPLEFTFYPRAYSYEAKVIGLQDPYQYGGENRKICQIQLVRSDVLSPLAESVKILSLSPNNFLQALECSQNTTHDNTKWDVIVKSDTSFNKLFNLNNKEISIIFGIDNGENNCTAKFHIGIINRGTKPDIRIVPKGGLTLHKGDKNRSFKLIITNRCHAKVFINSIDFKAVPDDLLKIKERVSKEIPAQGELTYTVLVNTSNCFNGNTSISVSTNDTDPALLKYPIEIKPYLNAKISIQPIDDIPKKIIGKQYKKNDLCIRCIIGHADDSPKDCLPIDLSKINLGENFCLAPAALKDTIIRYGEQSKVDLFFENDCSFQKKDTKEEQFEANNILKKRYYLPCKWNYMEQEGELKIPFALPKLYELQPIFEAPTEIGFPLTEDGRIIRVLTYKTPNRTDEDNNIFWDTNQKMTIESPFSFSESEIMNEIEIKPDNYISIFLYINEIQDIDANQRNIPDSIDITLICKLQSDNRSKEHKRIFKLKPIDAKPKLSVSYKTKDDIIKLKKNKTKRVPIKVSSQDEEVEARSIGEVVFRNVQEIPFKDEGISFEIKSISIKSNETEILDSRTSAKIPCDITILNGQSEECIPLYLIRGYEAILSGKSPNLEIEIVPFKNDNDGSKTTESSIWYKAELELQYDFVDDIYALDLGTTGIVIAKDTDNWPKCVILKDRFDNPIEESDEILSAHTMITSQCSNKELDPKKIDSEPIEGPADENIKNTSKIELAPEKNEYYSKLEYKKDDGGMITKFRLVPSKFIIGQDHIPFLLNFYNSEDISKNVQAFELNEEIDLGQEGKTLEEKESSISKLIAALYREIFSRCNQEVDKIKKLVVTYPNTYTIENLNRLKEILIEELGLNLNGQISFVPESDAVAAYYFNQIILDKHSFGPDEEAVVFYDMGAGTLDLSLVSFKKADDKIIASIVNKIGAPLAGNYLDYIICNALEAGGWLPSDGDDNTNRIAEKPNAIKNITTGIKMGFGDQRPIGKIQPSWLGMNSDIFKDKQKEIEKITYQQLIGEDNELFKAFLEACSKTALECLIPDNFKAKVHKIVFSGRGSQFAPLKNEVENEFKRLINDNSDKIEDKLKPIENCGDFMKTCVALGALQHQTFISGDGKFQMVNKNLFSKIAVVYFGKSKDEDKKDIFDVNVEYLVDPLDPQNDWENVEVVNGTRCKEFYVERTISDYMPGYMYYIQTCLNEDDLKRLYLKVYQRDSSYKDDLNWAFVNLLFKKRVKGSQPIPIKLKISKDNKIVEREIGGDILTGKKLLENVEDNIIYRRSMWPFIVTELK